MQLIFFTMHALVLHCHVRSAMVPGIMPSQLGRLSKGRTHIEHVNQVLMANPVCLCMTNCAKLDLSVLRQDSCLLMRVTILVRAEPLQLNRSLDGCAVG